ncbi:hypothetical protein IE53DRAFT_411013 [Violaceomyces palustris]|uniref:Uncharacterized protein n=1 Tax=Violaceomyces palustris TaxID=1673888 RepID=A0ACD0NWU7_9BASI|nr:hypothetical protein IE53DRAFT_411013 [Violaceomyces palustris]
MLRSLASPAGRLSRPSVASLSVSRPILARSLVSSVLLSSTRDTYESKKIAELKQELKSRGLSSSGRKEDLIKRLIDNDLTRAGSNISRQLPNQDTRSKSTLASLRTEPKKPQSSTSSPPPAAASPAKEVQAKKLAEKVSEVLKETDAPPELEAGSVHSAASDSAEKTGKSSPEQAPEVPSVATSPPGLPPQKAPVPKETFNVQIPYYDDPVESGPEIPIITSYTSPHARSTTDGLDRPLNTGPKVLSVSGEGEGLSHNAEAFDEHDFKDSTEKVNGLFSQILSDVKKDLGLEQGKSASKGQGAVQGLAASSSAIAKSVLSQAAQSFPKSSALGSSSSSSSGGSYRSNKNTRPLTDEERTGAWVLLGILVGGFALGGLGKPKEKAAHNVDERSTDVEKPKKQGGAAAQVRKPQPTSSGIKPSTKEVKAPVMCVPKPSLTSAALPASDVKPTGTLSQSTLAHLARLSTCEPREYQKLFRREMLKAERPGDFISDALVKLKVPNGGHIPGIEIFSPSHLDGETKICGPAFTVKMVAFNDKTSPKSERHYVDAAEPNSVMVITAPEGTRSAIWGGLMTARAQFLGVKGVVLDGRCRDLQEHRDANFPVFARGHSTLGQNPFTRQSELQVPITISDPTGGNLATITIHPGDIVIADLDGVVVVPPGIAEEAIRIAEKGKREDELCMKDLKAGKGVKETFATRRTK